MVLDDNKGENILRVLGRHIIEVFCKKHLGAKSSLQAWLCEIENVEWTSSEQIKHKYNNVDIIDDGRIIFHMSNYEYKLIALPLYNKRTLIVNDIGTIKEFSKWDLR